MNAARRAALVLHALEPTDREWMLARLTPARRGMLQPLLAELAELGIARDTRLVREIVADTTAAAVDDEADGALAHGKDPIAIIARAPAEMVIDALSAESAALIEWMLSLHAWPWRDELLAGLGRAKRDQIESLAAARRERRASGGDALREASLRELAARVRHTSVETAPPRPQSRLPRWLRFGRAT
jgi:hypothetical protein